MLGPHVIFQLVLQVALVVAVAAGESLLLAAIVSLVPLEGLHVPEGLVAPLAPVEILDGKFTMLDALVELDRGLVSADERAGGALECRLLLAGESLVPAQVLVAGELGAALVAGDATGARLHGCGIAVAADRLYVAVERHVLAEDLATARALELVGL